MKEISTTRKPTSINELQPSQFSSSGILFGRAIGRVKVPDANRQHSFAQNKEVVPKSIPDQPRIKLVRLMFYLPNICKESDASFSIEVGKTIVYVKRRYKKFKLEVLAIILIKLHSFIAE